MEKSDFGVLYFIVGILFVAISIVSLFGVIICNSTLDKSVQGKIAEKHIDVVDSDTIYCFTVIPNDTVKFLPKVTFSANKSDYLHYPLGYDCQQKILFKRCLRNDSVFQLDVFFEALWWFDIAFLLLGLSIITIIYGLWCLRVEPKQLIDLDELN